MVNDPMFAAGAAAIMLIPVAIVIGIVVVGAFALGAWIF